MRGRNTTNAIKKVDTKLLTEDFKKYEDKASKVIKEGIDS